MSRQAGFGLGAAVLGLACIVPVAADPEAPAKATALKFEVRLAKGLEPDGRDGRLLIVLSKEKDDDLRRAIGQTGTDVPPILAKDVKGLSADGVVTATERLPPDGGYLSALSIRLPTACAINDRSPARTGWAQMSSDTAILRSSATGA